MTEIELLTAQLVHCTKSMLSASARLNVLSAEVNYSQTRREIEQVALQLYADRADSIDEDSDAVCIIERAKLVAEVQEKNRVLEYRIQVLEAAGGAYESMRQRAEARATLIVELQKELSAREAQVIDLQDELECADLEIAHRDELPDVDDELDEQRRAYWKLQERFEETSKELAKVKAAVSYLPEFDGGAGLRAENAGLKNRVAELTRELETSHAMTWRKKNGELIPVTSMTDAHLRNALKMLEGLGELDPRPYGTDSMSDWNWDPPSERADVLKREANRRGLNW